MKDETLFDHREQWHTLDDRSLTVNAGRRLPRWEFFVGLLCFIQSNAIIEIFHELLRQCPFSLRCSGEADGES